MKVYELAKELGINNKTLLEYLAKEGCVLKSHMNLVPEKMVARAKDKFAKKTAAAGSGGIKAVALPKRFEKLVEAERAKKKKEEEENAEKAVEGEKSESAEESAAKKKKTAGVFNPQYSASLKEKAGSASEKSSEAKSEETGAAAKKRAYVPARDRKPDDYKEEEKAAAAGIKEKEADAAGAEAKSAEAEAKSAGAEAKSAKAEAKSAEAEAKSAGPVNEDTGSALNSETVSSGDEMKRTAARGEETASPADDKEAASQSGEEEAGPVAADKEAVSPAGDEEAASSSGEEEAASQESGEGTASAATETATASPASDKGTESFATDETKTTGETSAAEKTSEKAGDSEEKKSAAARSAADKKATKKSEAKARAQAQLKAETSRPGESEAIKSLRAKIVKGTINPNDLLGGARGVTASQEGGKGARQGAAAGRQGRGGRFGTGTQDTRGAQRPSTYGKDSRGASRGGAGSAVGAQAQDQRGGKSKGGRGDRGKYDKRGDKFDRLENEKGAMRASKQPAAMQQEEEEIKVITIPEQIDLRDFAAKLRMQPAAFIKEQFLKGKIFTLNDVLDFETAEEIALDKDIICEKEVEVDYIAELLKEEEDPEETLIKRPPVVVIMGHVDHGKTSLLDRIRKTDVTENEAGGITQRIGAYTVKINGESITFLDTPGHEAFTAMRLRGAQATDIAILVVAADDGVMPQTVEAINHARAAGIHIIVAVNKIDKPEANVDKVKQELSDLELVPEDWGGSTIFVPVSAKSGEGIESLLEMVILATDILELKANPNRDARGVVIEASLDRGRGSVATLLVQKGTLKVGDHIAIGEAYGKVRSMTNDKGQKVKTAGPSMPVEITGLNGVPDAGETFVVLDSDKEAKQFAQVYIAENKKKLLAGARSHVSLTDMFDQMKAGELKELNIIVKADVQGSVEAIKESLEKLSNDEIAVKCIHTGAGNVTVNDATLASASNAIIIAFNVDVIPEARDIIEHENIDLRSYDVIYNAIDDITLAMQGMYEPIYEEAVTGHIEVRQTFKASGVGTIAGSYVTDGIVKRTSKARLMRDGEQLFDGPIASLKRFADDVREVKSGFECGIVLKNFQDIKEGDTMEIYEMREVPRS